MLLKTHISPIKAGSDEWLTARLGKFTSSNIYKILAPKGFGETGMNYIRSRVGEELTKKNSDPDLHYLEAIRWGIKYEYEALKKFKLMMGWDMDFVVIQQLITEEGSKFGSSPDALRLISESPDEMSYQVENIEVKCPKTVDAYISLFECNTPDELKAVSPQYYAQVLDQKEVCGATKSYFCCYHPDFEVGNLHHIEFNYSESKTNAKGEKYFPLFEDLKLLRERKKQAEEKFYQIRDKLIMAGKY